MRDSIWMAKIGFNYKTNGWPRLVLIINQMDGQDWSRTKHTWKARIEAWKDHLL